MFRAGAADLLRVALGSVRLARSDAKDISGLAQIDSRCSVDQVLTVNQASDGTLAALAIRRMGAFYLAVSEAGIRKLRCSGTCLA
jgi:hypothetical protein